MPQNDNLIDPRFAVYKQFGENRRKINDSLKPDIFILLFDGMPSSNALKTDLGYDNSSLDSGLHSKGFYVPSYSKSNYDLTVLSMSSMFNMDYIPEKEIFYGNGVKMYYRSTSSLLDNSLIRILKSEDYLIRQYQPLSIFNNKDWEGNKTFGDMLSMNYFYKTLPGRIYRDTRWNIYNNDLFMGLKKKNYYKIASKSMADIQLLEKNIKQACDSTNIHKMVYAHFILPHPPLIFKKTGEIRAFKNGKTDTDGVTDNFIEQINYANLLIKKIADYILKHNKRNTIIIIQGDHGYNSKQIKDDFGFQNFSAIYFPDKNYQTLYSSLSPVNTFRIIINKTWKTTLPLLKDSCVNINFSRPDWED